MNRINLSEMNRRDFLATSMMAASAVSLVGMNASAASGDTGIKPKFGHLDAGAYERQPMILTPPVSVITNVTANVTLTISVIGDSVTYQWLRSGTNLVGRTNSTLTLTNVVVADSGSYAVVVATTFDSITNAANVTVNKATPLIGTVPTTTPITYGQTLTNSTLGSGNATNALGAVVAGGFSFATPNLVPKPASTNVTVIFTPTDSVNYNTNTATVMVTVNPAPLGVTANSTNKNYDGVAFAGGNGVMYFGFVNGDTSASLGGSVSYGGTSQGAIAAGAYSIIPSGLASANYNISYTNGTLTIIQTNPPAIAPAISNVLFTNNQFQFPMAGTGQPVEQTLQREAHQQHVVIFTRFCPALGQAGMD